MTDRRLAFALAAERGQLDTTAWTDEQLQAAAEWCRANHPTAADVFQAAWEARGPTLRQARAELRRHLRTGSYCPCCDRNAAIRRRAFSAPMALSLVWLVRQSGQHVSATTSAPGTPVSGTTPPASPQHARAMGWVRWAQEAPDAVHRKHEISRLVLFGTAERGRWDGTSKIDSGSFWYRPTDLGRLFVTGAGTVPRSVEVYANEALAFDTDRVDILAALRERFSLDDLLEAALSDGPKWDALIKAAGKLDP